MDTTIFNICLSDSIQGYVDRLLKFKISTD